MTQEPQPTRIVERVVIAKFDGDPPTPEHPKDPVEVVTIDRREDGHETVTITRGDD